jgi:hypothetical protein
MAHNSIWLLSLWRRKVFCSRPLWSTPIALAYEKRRTHSTGIALSSSLINNILLCLNYTARFPLVIYTDDLGPKFKGSSCGSCRERLKEGHKTLAIHDSARIEFRHSWNWRGSLCFIKVDYFL